MPIETYEQAVQFWSSRVDYEKLGMPQDLRVLKLDRMRLLLELLGNPQERYRIVHITGTKGKGSTAAMLASILQASGYRTGLYTSPHLVHVEERVRIDGEPIPAEELVGCMRMVASACEEVERHGEAAPTFFEIITAVGLVHFARRAVAWAVLEVGLGGRFDATNACTPEVAVITSISLDHMDQLGPTVESIAYEKAGIIKQARPVISGVREPGPASVIEDVARERQATLQILGQHFDRDWLPGDPSENQWPQVRLLSPGKAGAWYSLPLWGEHQADNAAIALATVEALRRSGLGLREEHVAAGLARTVVPGRLEVVGRWPWLVLDCAHNVASIQRLIDWVTAIPARRRSLLFAVSRDKQLTEMLSLLRGRFDVICFTRYRSSARGADPAHLLNLWRQLGGIEGSVMEPAAHAWCVLKHQAGPDELICATGSVFLAGEVRQAELAGRLHPPG